MPQPAPHDSIIGLPAVRKKNKKISKWSRDTSAPLNESCSFLAPRKLSTTNLERKNAKWKKIRHFNIVREMLHCRRNWRAHVHAIATEIGAWLWNEWRDRQKNDPRMNNSLISAEISSVILRSIELGTNLVKLISAKICHCNYLFRFCVVSLQSRKKWRSVKLYDKMIRSLQRNIRIWNHSVMQGFKGTIKDRETFLYYFLSWYFMSWVLL